MATVVVAGSSSRAGKTALAETVLRGLGGGASAVKFTTTEDIFEKCPRGTTCIVCDIDVPFKVIRDDFDGDLRSSRHGLGKRRKAGVITMIS